MVAGRAGYHAVGFFLRGQLGDLVVGSAEFDVSGVLEVFRLEVEF